MPLSGTAVGNAIIAALEKYHEAGDEAQQSHHKADFLPIAVVDVHGGAQKQRSYGQVEVRQAFINRF